MENVICYYIWTLIKSWIARHGDTNIVKQATGKQNWVDFWTQWPGILASLLNFRPLCDTVKNKMMALEQ